MRDAVTVLREATTYKRGVWHELVIGPLVSSLPPLATRPRPGLSDCPEGNSEYNVAGKLRGYIPGPSRCSATIQNLSFRPWHSPLRVRLHVSVGINVKSRTVYTIFLTPMQKRPSPRIE